MSQYPIADNLRLLITSQQKARYKSYKSFDSYFFGLPFLMVCLSCASMFLKLSDPM